MQRGLEMNPDPNGNPGGVVPGSADHTERGQQASRSQIPGRRKFLQTSLVTGIAAAMAVPVRPALGATGENPHAASAPQVASFAFDEVTIADLQDGMKSGTYTARSIAEKYLA